MDAFNQRFLKTYTLKLIDELCDGVVNLLIDFIGTIIAIYQESSDLIGNNVPLKFHI